MKIAILARPWQKTPAYRAYVMAQAAKTQKMGATAVAGTRVTDLVGLFLKTDPRPPQGRSVLCIGCRNSYELYVLRAAGFTSVIGIDLLSQEPSVVAMDMHRLTFPDGQFDVIFACHSLEHAYDLNVVLAEWARVTKPNGVWVIEVPVHFPPTDVDRQDLGSLAALQARCESLRLNTRYGTETYHSPGIVRLIVQKES